MTNSRILRRIAAGAAAAIAAMAAAIPAAASTLIAIISGTVLSGSDTGDYFGTGVADLAGQTFRQVFFADPVLGTRISGVDSAGAEFDGLIGGDVFGSTSPVFSLLSIGPRTVLIDGGDFGLFVRKQLDLGGGDALANFGATATHAGGADDIVETNQAQIEFADLLRASFRLESPVFQTFDLTGGDPSVVTGHAQRFDTVSSAFDYSAQFHATELTLAYLATPEPSTWALMLLGFGAVGVALRGGARRRPAA